MAVLIERKTYKKESSRERPIKIFLNDKPMAVSQGTPENLRELAVGYLLAEGLLTDRDKLRTVNADMDKAWVNVVSDEDNPGSGTVLHRVTSSGCAQSALLKEGAAIFDFGAMSSAATAQVQSEHQSIVQTSTEIPSSDDLESAAQINQRVFKADDLLAMMEQLCYLSPQRNDGDCVHGCGIGNEGELVCVREDIGRHNAMDKLIGQAWLDGVDMGEMALFTTGRISYEMALKAAHAGVSVMVSHKSVTDSAIELAEELGLTLVGKCRDNSMQVLSHHNRIIA